MQNSSIKAEIIKSSVISFITKYAGAALQIIISMALARVLTPDEYGIVSIVTVLSSFLALVGQVGMSPAIIQNDLEDREVISLYNISILFGGILALLFGFSGKYIALIYENEAYISLVMLLAIALFFDTSVMVPGAILRKQKKFFIIGAIEISASLISSLITLILALMGYSYYALVFGTCISSIINFAAKWKFSKLSYKFIYDIQPLKKIFRFTIFQLLTNLLTYFSGNIDNLAIGKMFGTRSLGIYDKAFILMRYPLNYLGTAITQVLHPIMSERKNDKGIIYHTFIKMSLFMAYFGIFSSVFLWFNAESIILIMFGEQWLEAVPILRAFCFSIWASMTNSLFGSFFQTLGRTDINFCAYLILTVNTIIGVMIGTLLKKSLVVVALIIGFGYWIVYFLFSFVLIKILLKNKISILYKQLLKPFLLACILVISNVLCEQFIGKEKFLFLVISLLVVVVESVLFISYLEKIPISEIIKKLVGKLMPKINRNKK